MQSLPRLRLKKGEDRRIRSGHPWIYSNEIDTKASPLKSFTRGEEVIIEAQDQTPIGVAYINPHSLISARMFSLNIDQRLDIGFFTEKLQAALDLRYRLFKAPYYRLVFSEADGLPGIVIDRYDLDFAIQVNTAGMELKKEMIVEALRSLVPELHSILFRNDSAIREQEGLDSYVTPAFGQPPEAISVQENDVRFTAPFAEGQKTGWFYDHRMNRARLYTYVSGLSVLDVFSYTGGFGIQSAVFGANQVTCLDASASACDYIKKNAALNQVEPKVTVLCEDAFDALKAMLKENKTFDVIILDPPAFVKRFKDKKEGLLAYQRLNEMALKLLVPGGILVSCSCSMQVSMDDLMEVLKRAAYRAQCSLQILERGHQGPDHPIHFLIPETEYLKAIFVRKVSI